MRTPGSVPLRCAHLAAELAWRGPDQGHGLLLRAAVVGHRVGGPLARVLLLARGRQRGAVDGLHQVEAVLGGDEVAVTSVPVSLGHHQEPAELLLRGRGLQEN